MRYSLRSPKELVSVSLLIMRGEQVLLVRRSAGGLFPHTWTLPGRELRAGEAPDGAAQTMLEGLALATSRIEPIALLKAPSPFRDQRGPDHLFLATARGPLGTESFRGRRGPGTPDRDGSSGQWFAPAALRDIRIFREARDAVLRYLPASVMR